jgi:hypothetical protein
LAVGVPFVVCFSVLEIVNWVGKAKKGLVYLKIPVAPAERVEAMSFATNVNDSRGWGGEDFGQEKGSEKEGTEVVDCEGLFVTFWAETPGNSHDTCVVDLNKRLVYHVHINKDTGSIC